MSGINGILSKESEMLLIFAQSLECQRLYNQPIQSDSFHTSNYYLLPKLWLDGYKEKYYNNLKRPKYEECTDYDSFKSKLLKNNPYRVENSNIIYTNVFQTIKKDTRKIQKYQIEYPINFYPIKEEIFQNNPIDKKEFLYELIIGENNIFIIDNRSKKNIFVCSIESENEELDDFIVNVNYILIYKNENIFKKEMMNYIAHNKGFEKYCKERNLNININEEQEIINKEMDKIGAFIVIKNNNIQTPSDFLVKYAEKNEDNKNIENNYRNNKLNKFNIDSDQIDFMSLSLGVYKNNLVNLNKNNNNYSNSNYYEKDQNINNNGNNIIINNNSDLNRNNNNQNNIGQTDNNVNNFQNNPNNMYANNYHNNINQNAFGNNYSNNFNQGDSNNFIQNSRNSNQNFKDIQNSNQNFRNNNSNDLNQNIGNNNINSFNQNNNINNFCLNNEQNINFYKDINPPINIRRAKKVIYYFPGDIYFFTKSKCMINKSYLESGTYNNIGNNFLINNNKQKIEYIPNNINYNDFQNNMQNNINNLRNINIENNINEYNNINGNFNNKNNFNGNNNMGNNLNIFNNNNNNYMGNNINNIGNNSNIINNDNINMGNNDFIVNNNLGLNNQNKINNNYNNINIGNNEKDSQNNNNFNFIRKNNYN